MGQKVNPYGLRIGITNNWRSRWYVRPRDYARLLHKDLLLRRTLEKMPELSGADVADVGIVRQPQKLTIVLYTAQPGIVIGTKGATIEKISAKLQKLVSEKLQIKVREIQRPEITSQLVAMNVARQLKTRSAFRRTMKMAVTNAMKMGIQGIKIRISGRLGGAEMSRSESYMQGSVPLHTLWKNIDYGFAEAHTTFGVIGVKVWIFVGDVNLRDQRNKKSAVNMALLDNEKRDSFSEKGNA